MNWISSREFNDLELDELEKRETRLSKTYAPLVAQINKNNNNFKDATTTSNTAEIHGDDDDNDNIEQYEKIEIPNDPSEYDKEEIKSLKKTISDLCKNIISVVNNPVSRFSNDDIVLVTDYLESVQIWLYTTNATTTIEFIAKIDEINKFTEDVMKKYEDTKIFEKNENFTIRDELQLTCLTLNTSIKSNYFSLAKNDIDILLKIINETMIWLLDHQNEQNSVYQHKIDNISELCNKIYHNMHKLQTISDVQDISSDSDDDIDELDTIESQISVNKIKENIDDVLSSLPEKINDNNNSNNDILLKIDMGKLNSNKKIKYKNIEHHYR